MKKEIDQYVGKNASVQFGALWFQVTVLDVKNSYGRNRFLISPVAGKGEMWVEKITLID